MPVFSLPRVLRKVFIGLEQGFSRPQARNLRFFLLGLILCWESRNIQDINRQLLRRKDQSSLNRFLAESPWKIEKLRVKRVRVVHHQMEKNLDWRWFLIVDDTVCPKTGRKMEGGGFHYCESEKKTVWGHNLVAAFWLGVEKGIPRFGLPHDGWLYRKKEECRREKVPFQSKVDLAARLIQESVVPAGIRPTILMDAWYGNKRLINATLDRGFDLVAAIKSDRNVYLQGKKIRVSELAKQVSRWEKVEINRKTYRTASFLVELPKVGTILLVISKKRGKKPKFLVTNLITGKIEKILKAYSYRWRIETFFEDTKKHLGLDQYQIRKAEAIRKYWQVVFTAYTLLVLANLSLPKKSQHESIGKTCEWFRNLFLKELLLKCAGKSPRAGATFANEIFTLLHV